MIHRLVAWILVGSRLGVTAVPLPRWQRRHTRRCRCCTRTTGSRDGFLFSVPGKLEGLGQVQGGFVQRQTMDRRPEIQDVPLDGTFRVKTLKGVLAQVDREGPLRVGYDLGIM